MVPIVLDALRMEQDGPVVNSMADFSVLPYTDGTQDYNTSNPNISEIVVSTPFQNETLHLKAGIHLHWALPDALSEGEEDGSESSYRKVPNRWLVTRRLHGTIDQQWVVESNYLYPNGEGDASGSVVVPVDADPDNGAHRPYRYMGRSMTLDTWLSHNSEADEYMADLTAIGYGEHAFAAFYPNCYSVFGFHDPDYAELPTEQLSYDVLGWYSDTADDPLTTYLAEYQTANSSMNSGAGPTDPEMIVALEEEFNWTLDESQSSLPNQILCFSRLLFSEESTNTAQTSGNTVSLGNTGMEAFSARMSRLLNDEITPATSTTTEDQLEYIHLADEMGNYTVDLGPKFRELRHGKGFASLKAGESWTIRLLSDSTTASDASSSENLTLPDSFATWLNELNDAQAAYEQAHFRILDEQKQLFSDWYKYLLCAYPPESTKSTYPDLDLVKNFISEKGIKGLEASIEAAGTLTLSYDEDGNVLGASSGPSSPDSLANTLEGLINSLLTEVADYNANLDADSTSAWVLSPTTAAPFRQPLEPVVLLTGDVLKPTSKRHGLDETDVSGDPLTCWYFGASSPDISENFIDLLGKIDELENTSGLETIGISTRTTQPWNPVLMEWEVEVFPLKDSGNQDTDDQQYQSDYITQNFKLEAGEPDLQPPQGDGNLTNGISVYKGVSILSTHANDLARTKLDSYLRKLIMGTYFEANPSEVDSDDYLYTASNVANLRSWYETNYLSSADDETKVNDPIYTAIRAFQQTDSLTVRSQSLNGFNEAMLQHIQVLQLEISDPLGFDSYQNFAEAVATAVDDQIISAPLPENDFNPIRTGAIRLNQLRLVDTFGQVLDLDKGDFICSDLMYGQEDNTMASLPPRVTQPCRLNFDWIAANSDEMEMNAHPATSPVCGWILANNLDNSIAVYAADGTALGSVTIDSASPWQSVPGAEEEIKYGEIENIHLQRFVTWMVERGSDFADLFISVIDNAVDNTEPDSTEQEQGLALLISQPLAVVRTALDLELQGHPAVHQGWTQFKQDLYRTTRDDNSFPDVKFPIRVGEFNELNDGLVGYLIEDASGQYEGNTFYATQAEAVSSDYVQSTSEVDTPVSISFNEDPLYLTMLMDPRAAIHATPGILPRHTLNLPGDQYADALKSIAVYFLNTPLLTYSNEVALALPDEQGYAWSWLEVSNGTWTTTEATDMAGMDQNANFDGPQEIREGWLKLAQTESTDN